MLIKSGTWLIDRPTSNVLQKKNNARLLTAGTTLSSTASASGDHYLLPNTRVFFTVNLDYPSDGPCMCLDIFKKHVDFQFVAARMIDSSLLSKPSHQSRLDIAQVRPIVSYFTFNFFSLPCSSTSLGTIHFLPLSMLEEAASSLCLSWIAQAETFWMAPCNLWPLSTITSPNGSIYRRADS